MKHYLLFYDIVDDYVERRAPLRDAHLAHAWAASERGELGLGGALADPVDGTVLLFRGTSPDVVHLRDGSRVVATSSGESAIPVTRPCHTFTSPDGPLGYQGGRRCRV